MTRARRRRIVTLHLDEEALKLLTNPEQNEGETRQEWKQRTFAMRYGTRPLASRHRGEDYDDPS